MLRKLTKLKTNKLHATITASNQSRLISISKRFYSTLTQPTQDKDTLKTQTTLKDSKVYNSEFTESKWRDLNTLTKFRLSNMNAFTVALGAIYAGGCSLDVLNSYLNSLIISCGLQAIGQVLEKDIDSKMKRTSNRPIVKDRLSSSVVMAASCLGIFG